MSKLLGIPLCSWSDREIIDWLFEDSSRFFYIVTPNVDHAVRLSDEGNKDFIQAYRNAYIAMLDSRIIRVILDKRFNSKVRVLTGSDLTKSVISNDLLAEKRVAIIGGKKFDVSKVKHKYNITKLFHYNPPMGFIDSADEIEKCIDFVEKHKPQVLFLAVGSPRQEILAYKLQQRISFGCKALCIGASINFLSGSEKRAPVFMQKYALEWLYRLLQDPFGKFKRYCIHGPNIFKLMFRPDFYTEEHVGHLTPEN